MAKAIYSMKKMELIEELDSYGINFSSKDTIPELAVRLQAARAKLNVKTKKEVKEENTDPTKGLAGLKKEELQNRMKDLGFPFTEHTTRNQMIAKIKGHFTSQEEGKDEDTLMFGKHSAWTYKHVRETNPQYVKWATDLVEDPQEDPHPLLVRFVRYCQNYKPPAAKVPVPMDQEELIQEAMRRIKAEQEARKQPSSQPGVPKSGNPASSSSGSPDLRKVPLVHYSMRDSDKRLAGVKLESYEQEELLRDPKWSQRES